EQVYNMRVNIADSALSALLVWILIPRMGVPGYLIVIYITELLNASLSITKLITLSRFGGISPVKAVLRWAALPLLLSIGAVSAAKVVTSIMPPLPMIPSLVLSITLAAAIYGSLSAISNVDILFAARKKACVNSVNIPNS
ncbi:MAG: polysaccharide biosynthesis C-terminal domain-containing protein, partial [Eubacteriales bacterium]